MKNDSAPLSTYHIKPNSTIAIIGTNDPPIVGPSATSSKGIPLTTPTSATEQSTLNTINSELETVRTTLKPSVDAFLESLGHSQLPPSAADAAPPLERNDPKQAHRILGELLLQSLLRLDAIMPEGGWTEVRSARKGAVREIQGLLDRLDEGWRGCSHSL